MAAVGYARVSTADQDLALQLDALAAAGCAKVFEDRASGARADRPGLRAALDYAREGDVLVTWKLDRLGRSLPHLIETVAGLERRGGGSARSRRERAESRAYGASVGQATNLRLDQKSLPRPLAPRGPSRHALRTVWAISR